MSRILADVKSYSKQYLRSKVGAFFGFAFPILLILLFGAIFTSSETNKLSLPVQNLDEGGMGQQFIDAMNHTGIVNVQIISSQVDLAKYTQEKSLSLVLLIPSNFSANVAAGIASNGSVPANVILYGDVSQTTYQVATAAVDAVATGLNFGIAGAQPVIGFDRQPPLVVKRMEFMDFFLPGVVGITVMTSSLYSMSSICASYRERGYFKLLATTKLAKHEWLISKFIFYTIFLYASLFATFAVGKLVFNLTATLTPMALLMIPAGVFLFVSLGMLIGVGVKEPESSVAISNAVGFPMMFLSGAFFQLETMPSFMRTISTAMPLTYFNNGLRDTMVYGNTMSALANLGVLLAIGVVFFVLASKLMSWKER